MLAKLKAAAQSVTATAVEAAGAVGSRVGEAAGAVPELARTAVGAVGGVADGALGAVAEAGRTARLAVEEKRLAVEAAVDDGLWAVRRPVEKVGHVAVGMAKHATGVMVGRAVDKLAERLFGSVWLGPLAPVGAVIGVVETIGDLLEAIDEFNRLASEADRRLDAAERARLAARRQDAEARLAALRPGASALATATEHVAAVVGGPDTAVRFDITVLEGRHAGRMLSELTRAEVEALHASAPDAETGRLIGAWLALHPAG